MTASEVLLIILFFILIADIGWFTITEHRADKKWETQQNAEKEKENQEKTEYFYLSAIASKIEADENGMNYAFGKAECDEREKAKEAINNASRRGLYSCELDFPISQRSLDWLQHCGFEASQAEGKTLVSWENAKV